MSERHPISSFYDQSDELAMGSLSLYMEQNNCTLQTNSLALQAQVSGQHLRCLAAWTQGTGGFHKHLNTQQPNTNFITVEVEKDNKLFFSFTLFLDVHVTRRDTS